MRRGAWFLVFLLTACTSSPAAAPASASAEASPTPSAAASRSLAASEATLSIESVLPTALADVELHTFEIGGDILARLADAHGVAVDELETAFASEHGARFIQMYAIRLPGTSATALATTWAEVAYPPDVTDVEVAQQAIDDRPITVVTSPSLAPQVGTFYLHPRDDILFVVQAFDPVAAREALAALP